MTKARAIYELIFAGVLWGFGFVATIWALQVFSPALTLVLRFALALFMGEIIRRMLGGKSAFSFSQLRASWIAGLLLAIFIITQTIGLKYTTASKSGFLTCLYVVFVPMFDHFMRGKKVRLALFRNVLLSLVGAFLLTGGNFSNINQGDWWTVACAVVSAFHILYIDRIARDIHDPFAFNNGQSFWAALFLLPLIFFETQPLGKNLGISQALQSPLPWLGLLFLALGSSTLAFLIQIRTQKVLEPTTASMLFLLEGIFSWLFGVLLLGETLEWIQVVGAFLILVAAYMQVQRSESK